MIRNRVLLETKADDLRHVLDSGTVATNVFLRRIHNFALGMGWIVWPILAKKQWPEVRFAENRAITWNEHLEILDREPNKEKATFYDLAWHIGAAQTDLANLRAEDIDWGDCVIAFRRAKTGTPSLIRLGNHVAMVLKKLPRTGYLFPALQAVSEKRRADYFRKRCLTIGICGVTLHSYRYAWAERAKTAGYPERFAQEALGHNSKAVHRAYAAKAQVNHARSLAQAMMSAYQKNFSPFAGGFPRYFKSLAATKTEIACGGQLKIHAVCSTLRRAGGCLWSDRKKRCWSFMFFSWSETISLFTTTGEGKRPKNLCISTRLLIQKCADREIFFSNPTRNRYFPGDHGQR